MRKIDEKATGAARRRQARAIARLNEVFRASRTMLLSVGFDRQTGRPAPVRQRPGCPPARTAEGKRRHRLRKISAASRRRNR